MNQANSGELISRREAVSLGARLVGLFLLCFLIPVGLFFILANSGPATHHSPGKAKELAGVVLNVEGELFEVADSAELQPDSATDFMLTVWLRFRRFPRVGERVVVASQWNPELAGIPGYSLAVKHEDGFLRPQVYWRGGQSVGRWFEFPGLALLPQRWFCLVLSYHKQQYVGLHVINDLKVKYDFETSVLGSHLLEGEATPLASASFKIGSNSAGRNRMEIGPVLILKGERLRDKFRDILVEIARDRSSPPKSIAAASVIFRSNNLRDDLSGGKRKIIFRRGAEA